MFGWLRRIFASVDLDVSYAHFTDRARKVMQLANQEAQRFNHEYIGTEHILLGLVAEANGVAGHVLKDRNVDLGKIRLEVEKIVQHGPGGEQVVMGRLPHTPQAKKVIDHALEEARLLNHLYVGTEHLLLGLLREQEGVAVRVLMNLGLKLENVREEVLSLLSYSMPTEGGPAPSAPAASQAPSVTPAPPELTRQQLDVIGERVRQITEQKKSFVAAQDFAQAARCREELLALTGLLAWYEWIQA